MKVILWGLTALTLGILIFIIVTISINGLPQVTPSFLLEVPRDMGRAGGIFSTIVATAYITALAILLASPLGTPGKAGSPGSSASGPNAWPACLPSSWACSALCCSS